VGTVQLGGRARLSPARARPGWRRGRTRRALHAEIEVNAALNARTADLAEAYRPHRDQVMRLLRETAETAGREHLVILGAGNCNDVDLSELLGVYEAVTLVDIDAAAMARAVKPLAPSERMRLDRRALDLGVPDAAQARRILGAAGRGASAVLSATLLTQLIAGALDGGPGSPALGRAATRQRRLHLSLMMRLLAPGGRGILVTDLVSSAQAGALTGAGARPPAARMAECCATGTYFAGTRPNDVLADMARLRGLAAGSLRRSAAWVWTLEAPYAYLVYAAAFARALSRP